MANAREEEADQKVDVEFESHPPIDTDLEAIAKLIRQTLLNYVDSTSLAKHLIELKDVTQIIALGDTGEEESGDEDEGDNDIYGVSSVIDLTTKPQLDNDPRKSLLKFLKDKSSAFKTIVESANSSDKIAFIVNERYINLPPQLSLPTFKNLTQHLNESQYTHLIFLSKIQIRVKNSDANIPNKKIKSKDSSRKPADPLVFVNPEEEIIFEGADHYVDVDVSAHCDENATWSFNNDAKYIPHRRVMIIDYKKWPDIMRNLEKELN